MLRCPIKPESLENIKRKKSHRTSSKLRHAHPGTSLVTWYYDKIYSTEILENIKTKKSHTTSSTLGKRVIILLRAITRIYVWFSSRDLISFLSMLVTMMTLCVPMVTSLSPLVWRFYCAFAIFPWPFVLLTSPFPLDWESIMLCLLCSFLSYEGL